MSAKQPDSPDTSAETPALLSAAEHNNNAEPEGAPQDLTLLADGGRPSLKVFKYGGAPEYILVFSSAVFNLAAGCVMPIFMTLFGDMLDSVGKPGAGKPLKYYICAQLICGAVSFTLSFAGAATMEIAAERQVKAMKLKFLDNIMRQEMGWFDQFDSGKLSTTLQQNTITIREAIGLKFAQAFMFLGMFIGGYAVGFYQDWKMTLVVSATLPFLAAGAFIMFSAVGKADETARRAYAEAGSVVEETLVTIRSIVAFGLESRMVKLFSGHLEASYNAGVKSSIAIGAGFALTMGVCFLSYALGFWYGGKLVADSMDKYGDLCNHPDNDCYTGGTAMSVFFCVLIAAFALGQAGPNITALGKAGAAMKAMDRLISRQTLIDPTSEDGFRPEKSDVQGEIQFENVNFSYPTRPHNQVYKNLTMRIPAGTSVALVGGSGCGKSTSIQLVERFYDVDSGRIIIDGRNVRDYHLKSLRKRIALVSQEPRLFASTIMENIRAGKLDASDDEVMLAAKQANAHTFIEGFPEKYNTFVGEGGGQLSGGQKQRIAIARAIIRDPSILILDEATSALDNESEKIVQETLDKLVESQKRTTIIIAHRLTTVRRADKIIVLDNEGEGSRLAEEGTHAELMQLDGLYAALVEAQRLDTAANEEEDAVLPLVAQFKDELPRKASSLLRLRSKFSRQLSKRAFSHKQSNAFEPGIVSKRLSQELSTIKEAVDQPLATPQVQCGGFVKVVKNFKPHILQVSIGLFGAAMNGLTFPCFAIVFARLINAFYLPTSAEIRSDAKFWSCVFVGFSAGVAVANLLQHSCFAWAGHKVVQVLRTKTFDSMVHQDMAFFDDPKHSSGALSELLSADIILLKGWVGDNLGIYVQNIVALIAALIVAFTASPKLAGVALGGFMMMAPAQVIESKFVSHGSNAIQDQAKNGGVVDYDSTAFLLQETVMNIRTVAAYTLEDNMSKRYQKIVLADYKRGTFNAYLGAVAWGFSQFASFAVQALCLGYGGHLVTKGEIGPTEMMQSIFALLMAAMGMGQTMIFATDNKAASAASHRVYEVIERQPLVDARSDEGQQLSAIHNGVTFTGVNFRYPQRPDVPIYSNINFTINKGEVVALVGPSGCGKSTAVQLIERFYDLTGAIEVNMEGERTSESGRIAVDGLDLRDLNVRSLRSRIGLVNQEPILFSSSIADNIACGRPDGNVSAQEIEEIAKKANAYNFIMDFPEKFETNVGKMGGQLSGGQKQRIAIARALVRDPDLLILDEATSALDAESEKIVQAALDKLLSEKQRTTIMIAHRLSTVKNADKIVVLVNKGAGSYVAEVGKHEELLNIPDGVYRHLVEIAGGK